jgi:hypothetical protein
MASMIYFLIRMLTNGFDIIYVPIFINYKYVNSQMTTWRKQHFNSLKSSI